VGGPASQLPAIACGHSTHPLANPQPIHGTAWRQQAVYETDAPDARTSSKLSDLDLNYSTLVRKITKTVATRCHILML